MGDNVKCWFAIKVFIIIIASDSCNNFSQLCHIISLSHHHIQIHIIFKYTYFLYNINEYIYSGTSLIGNFTGTFTSAYPKDTFAFYSYRCDNSNEKELYMDWNLNESDDVLRQAADTFTGYFSKVFLFKIWHVTPFMVRYLDSDLNVNDVSTDQQDIFRRHQGYFKINNMTHNKLGTEMDRDSNRISALMIRFFL